MVLIQLLLPAAPAAGRDAWRDYAAELARRFGQDTIHVRALPVEMPNEGDV